MRYSGRWWLQLHRMGLKISTKAEPKVIKYMRKKFWVSCKRHVLFFKGMSYKKMRTFSDSSAAMYSLVSLAAEAFQTQMMGIKSLSVLQPGPWNRKLAKAARIQKHRLERGEVGLYQLLRGQTRSIAQPAWRISNV